MSAATSNIKMSGSAQWPNFARQHRRGCFEPSATHSPVRTQIDLVSGRQQSISPGSKSIEFVSDFHALTERPVVADRRRSQPDPRLVPHRDEVQDGAAFRVRQQDDRLAGTGVNGGRNLPLNGGEGFLGTVLEQCVGEKSRSFTRERSRLGISRDEIPNAPNDAGKRYS
ncbi:hypothetical protein [Caballeronia sordidicola]|uniref:hypothetical protein n=1 Tax=Caballeronia sordidicola TaxID=196367 RepID=UPI001364553D|nr:hypothetical protein [Caballeronia sordidicola]